MEGLQKEDIAYTDGLMSGKLLLNPTITAISSFSFSDVGITYLKKTACLVIE